MSIIFTIKVMQFGINLFRMGIYNNYDMILTIDYIDTNNKYHELQKLKKLTFDNNTIIIKNIFNHDVDYENHISQINVYEYTNIVLYCYIDFSDCNFTFLNSFYIINGRKNSSMIINLDTSSIKHNLIIKACFIDTDTMNFIKSFINLTEFYLYSNKLEYEADIGDFIANMKNLKILFVGDVVDNNLLISDNSFNGLDKLTKITINNGNISSVRIFEKIVNLEELTIASTSIEKTILATFAKYLQSTNSSLIRFDYYP